jgi:hypothetical protein
MKIADVPRAVVKSLEAAVVPPLTLRSNHQGLKCSDPEKLAYTLVTGQRPLSYLAGSIERSGGGAEPDGTLKSTGELQYGIVAAAPVYEQRYAAEATYAVGDQKFVLLAVDLGKSPDSKANYTGTAYQLIGPETDASGRKATGQTYLSELWDDVQVRPSHFKEGEVLGLVEAKASQLLAGAKLPLLGKTGHDAITDGAMGLPGFVPVHNGVRGAAEAADKIDLATAPARERLPALRLSSGLIEYIENHVPGLKGEVKAQLVAQLRADLAQQEKAERAGATFTAGVRPRAPGEPVSVAGESPAPQNVGSVGY